MGLFERFLTVWVGLGMPAGVGLGLAMPTTFQAIAGLEIAHVNLVVAVFIWVMIFPTMIQIDWTSVNDLVMVVAFAPIAAFLLGVTDIHVPSAGSARGC